MKRAIVTLAFVLIAYPANGNEIPGTRVSGQGAVCGEGQGKAVEVNATTKQESSYCFERPVVVVTPTPTPTPTPSPTPTPTQTTPTPEPTPTQTETTQPEPVSEPTTDS